MVHEDPFFVAASFNLHYGNYVNLLAQFAKPNIWYEDIVTFPIA